MSSNSHPTVANTAPWKPILQSHLDKSGGPSAEFCLATVTNDGLPRVRTCIHRGFWCQLAENPYNKLDKNPKLYETDCPAFTTDARMEKVFDIFATGKGKGTREQAQSGSGGGGPVEAVYWVKPTMTQWRIRGKCWFIAADDVEGGTEEAQNSGTLTMKAELGRYMRKLDENSSDVDWSWKREVENHFENLAPMMRGSFKAPKPGGVLNDPSTKKPGEEFAVSAGSLLDEDIARKNFRVAIITPEVVEQIDLGDPPSSRQRWQWTLSTEAGGPRSEGRPVGEWNLVETWP